MESPDEMEKVLKDEEKEKKENSIKENSLVIENNTENESQQKTDSNKRFLLKNLDSLKLLTEKSKQKATTTDLISKIFSRTFTDIDDTTKNEQNKSTDELLNDSEGKREKETKKNKGDNNGNIEQILESIDPWLLHKEDLKNKKFSWNGNPLLKAGSKFFYKSVINKNNVIISMGDYVLFTITQENTVCVCRILFMYKEGHNGYFHGPLFMLSRNSPLAGIARENELFYMDKCMSGKLSDVISLLKVQWVDPEYTDSADIDKLDCFYWRGKLLSTNTFSFVSPAPEEVAECSNPVTTIKTCLNCIKEKDRNMKDKYFVQRSVSEKDVISFEHNGEVFTVNSFVLVNSGTWHRPSKHYDEYHEEYEHRSSLPEIFTEMHRKKYKPYL